MFTKATGSRSYAKILLWLEMERNNNQPSSVNPTNTCSRRSFGHGEQCDTFARAPVKRSALVDDAATLAFAKALVDDVITPARATRRGH